MIESRPGPSKSAVEATVGALSSEAPYKSKSSKRFERREAEKAKAPGPRLEGQSEVSDESFLNAKCTVSQISHSIITASSELCKALDLAGAAPHCKNPARTLPPSQGERKPNKAPGFAGAWRLPCHKS